jgi:hypothetical protein
LVGLGLAVLTIMGVKKENRKKQTPIGLTQLV